jgi:hypothetical protein
MFQLKKTTIVFTIVVIVFASQSFTSLKHDDHEKPTNLIVLPKDISGDELHLIMRQYSKALGVRCGFCHERKEGQEHADFASDNKHEKEITRDMMRMVNDINEKYLAQSGNGHFEKITCVTCHMGRKVPIISTDSLPKNANERDPKKIQLPKSDSIAVPTKKP